jgi:hypothetical protein
VPALVLCEILVFALRGSPFLMEVCNSCSICTTCVLVLRLLFVCSVHDVRMLHHGCCWLHHSAVLCSRCRNSVHTQHHFFLTFMF